MKKNIINIFIGVLFLIFGIKLYDSNKGASSQQENVVSYNNFCQNGIVLNAQIDSIVQLKNFYTHKFSYQYNNKKFHQSLTTNIKFEKSKLEISILKSDPNKYIIGNACKNLTSEIENNKSTFWEYVGILLIIYGFFVILIKSIKTILSIKDKNQQLTAFEKKNKRVIPNSIRKILEYRLANNKKIEFEIPNYWSFKVINYNNIEENDFGNPYFTLKEVDQHIERYLLPLINYSKIIPFAVNNNYCVLFVEEGKEDIILINLDSAETKPLILKNKIGYYLDIDKLELKDDKYYYNGLKKIKDLVDENNYFFDIPDGIFEGKDYYDIFIKSFNLLENKPAFSFLAVEETKENYTLTLNIEGKSKKIKLNRYSHYLDSDELIKSLNEILSLLNYNQKKYYLISNSICDFGIVLADEKLHQSLLDNGCVQFNEENLKLSSDELNDIRKYSDLMTEIENIEFHLEVTKKNNEIKKGILYQYIYDTNYEFDGQGIKELKKRLNVNIKKNDSGYDIYFTL